LVPFAFAGEEPISATLLGGVSVDFNVMTRRARVRAEVRIVRATETLAESAAGVLFAARGEWRADGNPLAANAGLWWNDNPSRWTVKTTSADAALIAVSIHDP